MAKNQLININDSEITFYPDSHRYKVDGKWVSSVTTVLGLIDKSRQLLKWSENLTREYLKGFIGAEIESNLIESAVTQYTQIRDEAGDIGKQIHSWIERFIDSKVNNAEPPEITPDMNEAVTNGIMAFINWYSSNKVEFLESERIVYSKKYNYIGTLDVIMRVNDEVVIGDFKSGKGVYAQFWYQLSAYRQAFLEEFPKGKIDKYMILHFDKETGDFKIYTKELTEVSVEHFNNLLSLKLDLARLERKS